MNMKTILFTIFSILAVLSLTGCSASGTGKADDTLDEHVDHIEVIYFHGNMRCLTCNSRTKLWIHYSRMKSSPGKSFSGW